MLIQLSRLRGSASSFHSMLQQFFLFYSPAWLGLQMHVCMFSIFTNQILNSSVGSEESE